MAKIPVIINVKEKGAKRAEKNIRGLSGSLKGMASNALLAGGAFLGAGALVAGIKAATAAAAEQQLSEKKLEAAFGKNIDGLKEYAKALQEQTMFGDEAILTAQAMLGSFIKDEEQMKLATKATLDLAAAKGMDLNAAADLVGKSFGSSTNALTRYGVEAEGAAGSTERLESLTANVAKLFGGQAEAQAQTFAGTMTQTKNALGDLAEVIGSAMTPAIGRMASRIKVAAEFWGDFLDTGKENKDESEKLTGELGKLNTQIKSQQERIELLKQAYMDGEISFHKFRDTTRMIDERIDSLNEKFKSQEEIIRNSPMHEVGLFDGYLDGLKKVEVQTKSIDEINERIDANKKIQVANDTKNAALSGKTASDSMKQVVRAETMEAVSGQISSIFKNVPYPLNLLLAAAAGGTTAALMDKALSQVPQFATGGDFVTSGPQMIMVGDNPSGRERVQVTPLGGDPNINGPQGSSINVTISGNVMSKDYVEGELADAIKEATRRGVAFS